MINLGFWKEIKEKADKEHRPLFVLAPMADVTDVAFRNVIARYGKPDVMWTEFVAADGLMRATPVGKAKLMRDLLYSEIEPTNERPIVAQLFSSNPEYMKGAAKLVAELGFDGIDINMGCPDKTIEKQGCGSAMIKTPLIAQAIIKAAKDGAEEAWREAHDAQSRGIQKLNVYGKPVRLTTEPIPVSVKTRIGYNVNELDTWLPALLEAEPAAITIHCRTRKEMSDVPARWEHIAEAVKIRNEFFIKKYSTNSEPNSSESEINLQIQNENKNNNEGQNKINCKTLIFGNGDALSISDAHTKATSTGAEGVMLGRAIFGNPWLFSAISNADHIQHQPTIKERLSVLIEHTALFEKLLGDIKSFAVMKKHYKAYVTSIEGAGKLREELMKTENAEEVSGVIVTFLNSSN